MTKIRIEKNRLLDYNKQIKRIDKGIREND